MKKSIVLLSVLLSASAVEASQPAPQVVVARTTIQAFAKQLGGELKMAMKAGGPINAIGVCNVKAPQIAQETNKEGSAKISRTSLKNRNADNAPTDWQRAVLLKFEERKAAGEDVTKMDHSEVVGDQFRYMKAIPTAEICLKCHGANIDPKIAAKLDMLYPEDKARGFKKGDIRGAFYVTQSK